MAEPQRTDAQTTSITPTLQDADEVLNGKPPEVWRQYLAAVHANLDDEQGRDWLAWLTARPKLRKAFQRLYPGQDPEVIAAEDGYKALAYLDAALFLMAKIRLSETLTTMLDDEFTTRTFETIESARALQVLNYLENLTSDAAFLSRTAATLRVTQAGLKKALILFFERPQSRDIAATVQLGKPSFVLRILLNMYAGIGGHLPFTTAGLARAPAPGRAIWFLVGLCSGTPDTAFKEILAGCEVTVDQLTAAARALLAHDTTLAEAVDAAKYTAIVCQIIRLQKGLENTPIFDSAVFGRLDGLQKRQVANVLSLLSSSYRVDRNALNYYASRLNLRARGIDVAVTSFLRAKANRSITREVDLLVARIECLAALSRAIGGGPQYTSTLAALKMKAAQACEFITRVMSDDEAAAKVGKNRYSVYAIRGAMGKLIRDVPEIRAVLPEGFGDRLTSPPGDQEATADFVESVPEDGASLLAAAVKRVAHHSGGAKFDYEVYRKLAPRPATAVLDFLRAVDLAAQGFESKSLRARLREFVDPSTHTLDQVKLGDALRDFLKQNILIDKEMHEARPGTPRTRSELGTEEKTLARMAVQVDRSAQHDNPTLMPAEPAHTERWVAKIGQRLKKRNWLLAPDTVKLNKIIDQVHANGPDGADDLHPLRKRLVYQVHSATSSDHRIVGVATMKRVGDVREYTLTFQAVYNHPKSGGKDFVAGERSLEYEELAN